MVGDIDTKRGWHDDECGYFCISGTSNPAVYWAVSQDQAQTLHKQHPPRRSDLAAVWHQRHCPADTAHFYAHWRHVAGGIVQSAEPDFAFLDAVFGTYLGRSPHFGVVPNPVGAGYNRLKSFKGQEVNLGL